MRFVFAALLFLIAAPAHAEPRAILVTIDGLRWQEAFHGADPALVATPEDRARYLDPADRARALMPFLQSFSRDGAFIGDRLAGSCMRVENRYWFSYPGYAEMLSGRPDSTIGSNAKRWNPRVTAMEWLNGRGEFKDKVRVFAEWDVAPYIVNARRSGVPVIVAPQDETWRDPPTMQAARTMFSSPTRAAWIDLGDTDTRAHAGDYAGVLAAAQRADVFLAELWATIESNPEWAGQTTLLVTVDHGRGEAAKGKWKDHGSGRFRGVPVPGVRREGSDATWLAARGPGIRPGAGGYTMANCATTAQVAGTLLKSLGLEVGDYSAEARAPLDIF